MSVESIFSDISQHMIEGIMFHEQMSEYFDFLGLCGYRKLHEYQYHEESKAFRSLNKFYMSRYHKLIPTSHSNNPNVIPDTWFRYSQMDVDASTKRNAISMAFDRWVSWEEDTKNLLTRCYGDLCEMDEIATSTYIKNILTDVDDELSKAHKYKLELQTIEYDMSYIIDSQKCLHSKYTNKLKHLH